MDMNSVNRADWERRRKIRLTQVRDQSKAIAKSIRDRVHGAVELQSDKCETLRQKSEHKFKSLAVNKLKSDFDYLIKDIGHGYSAASDQPDPNIVLTEKRLIDRCKAISRGVEAEKRQKLIQEEKLMDKEMHERRIHFNRTVEKIRSTLITSIPNVYSNHEQNKSSHNECFLIPSQVTLNESDIINWSRDKKNSKPWAMAINSEQNQKTKFCQSATNDDKENEPKFKQLENDVRNYASLVSELDKLSAEEQNIKYKLFTHRKNEVPVPSNKCIPSSELKNNKHKHVDGVEEYIFSTSNKSNKKQYKITEKKIGESNSSSSDYKSSESTDIENVIPGKPTKKTNHIENIKIKPSNPKLIRTKSTPEKPLKNINNLLQRIKKKKQLLAKEISVDRATDGKKEISGPERTKDVKKLNTASSIPKTTTNQKRYAAGYDSYKKSPMIYSKLPDSFYSSKIKSLEEQITKEKTKYYDAKCNTSMNPDLMRYINVLLKMTPSDIENLSTSSCSSVKLEESLMEHTEKNTQFYHELLNCMTKCFNTDFSDISQETSFESPKNINVINKLQELAKYYSDKTHEMKNICDESSLILNEHIETVNENFQGESTSNMTSDSSFDGEYLFGHLNTLMQKKRLIKSDKEWPLFEDKKDFDDNRSLTDQLLDV